MVAPAQDPPVVERPLSIVAVSVTAGLGAALVGLLVLGCLVLAAWATDPRAGGDLPEVLRFAGGGWIVANLGTVAFSGAPYALPPLGLTALSCLLVARAAASAARAAEIGTLGQAVRVAAATGATYGVVGLLLVGPVSGGAVQVPPLPAFLGPYAVAAPAALLGAVRAAGLAPSVRDRVPLRMRVLGPTTSIATLTLVGSSSLLLAASLVLHREDVLQAYRDLDPGVGGTVGLAVLSILALPNMVVWTVGYASGAGLTLGTGTLVSPFEVDAGPLPAFPPLAAVPTSGPSVLAWAVLVVPLTAGVLVGVVAAARSRRSGGTARGLSGWARALGRTGWVVLGTALSTGVVVAVLAVLSSGAVGPGRMAFVGVHAPTVALAVAVGVSVGGAVGALLRPAPPVSRR